MDLEAEFVLVVTGAAIIWPPLALIVGGAFLVALKVLHWRMSGEAAPEREREQETPQ